MADQEQNKNTSFRQFELCALCKVNHNKRKKHIYSKHHQLILRNIVNKFSSKIQSVKQNLFSPNVQDGNFEQGAKFWCYFCKEEYLKHDVLEMTTIVGAGLLEHIASEEHNENMVQFFWDNLLDKKLKPKFVLSLADLTISKKAAFLAVKKFQKAKGLERKQLAGKIEEVEANRRFPALALGQSESSTSTSQLSDLPGYSGSQLSSMPGYSGSHPSSVAGHWSSEAGPSVGRKRTMWAQGPGLTSIIKAKSAKDEVEESGNVHTGATPPWLKPDTPSNTGEIGPTMADFQKHLERERKAKLPAGRVGAGFDHKTATAEDWLPSFGRVWSKGRRQESRKYFEKEWKGKQPAKRPAHHSNPTSTAPYSAPPHSNKPANHSSPWNKPTNNSHPRNKPTNDSQPWNQPSNHNRPGPSTNGPHVPYTSKSHSMPSETQTRPDVPVVPYKRRKEADSSGGREIRLLQTPLLSERDF